MHFFFLVCLLCVAVRSAIPEYLTEIRNVAFAEQRSDPTFAAIHPQDTNQLVVSFRGAIDGDKGKFDAEAPGGGLIIYNVTDPSTPTAQSWWKVDYPVEGEDRVGDTLVAVAMTKGKLYTFDVANPTGQMIPTGSVKFGNQGHQGLHVRIYSTGAKNYAIVTSGFSSGLCVAVGINNDYEDGDSNSVWAIDITDPSAPVEVAHVEVPDLVCPEGVLVSGDYAYIGGINSDHFAVIDLTGLPSSMTLLREYEADRFNQMVGMSKPGSNSSYFALWTYTLIDGISGSKGGISEWDTSDPRCPKELNYLYTESCKNANRVFLIDSSATKTYALLPLENNQGGVCFVDVSARGEMVLRQVFTLDEEDTMLYALAAKDDYLYLVVQETSEFRQYQVDWTKVDAGMIETASTSNHDAEFGPCTDNSGSIAFVSVLALLFPSTLLL